MIVGIVLKDLGPNQAAYQSISSVNSLIEDNSPCDFCFYYEQINLACVRPKCGIFSMNNFWGVTGMVICTNLYQVSMIQKAACEATKIFYVYDLEWLRPHAGNYLWNLSIYRDPSIHLVARSAEHARSIENYCNRRPIVIEDFKVGDFINAFQSRTNQADSRTLRFGMFDLRGSEGIGNVTKIDPSSAAITRKTSKNKIRGTVSSS